jgi:hypothetical protein
MMIFFLLLTKIVTAMKIIKNIKIFSFTFILLLVGCGPSLNDAKKLGFDSIEEMNFLRGAGFKTRADFDKLGFLSLDEYKDGVKLGFSSGEIYKLKKKYGFEDKAQYELYLNSSPNKRFEISVKNAAKIINQNNSFGCLATYSMFKQLHSEKLSIDSRTSKGVEYAEIAYVSILYEHGFSEDAKEISERVRLIVEPLSKKWNEVKTLEELERFASQTSEKSNLCSKAIMHIYDPKEVLKYQELLGLTAKK